MTIVDQFEQNRGRTAGAYKLRDDRYFPRGGLPLLWVPCQRHLGSYRADATPKAERCIKPQNLGFNLACAKHLSAPRHAQTLFCWTRWPDCAVATQSARLP